MTWGCTPSSLRGRTQQRFFDITEEERRGFGYPDALDVDFNKRAEIDCEELRAEADQSRASAT